MNQYNIKELKSGGFMKHKEKDLFSVRLRVVGGYIRSHQLPKLAEIANKYGRGHIHLTTRQGIEIPYVHIKDFRNLKKELVEVGLEVGACGPRVRTITACQGGSCSHGLIDSQKIAKEIDKRLFGKSGLPHKLKIGVTGCPNACIKPQENDIGIMGIMSKICKQDLCNLCGLCAEVCPVKAIKIKKGKLEFDENKCIGCGDCVFSCPTGAWEKVTEGCRLFLGGKMGKFPKLGIKAIDFIWSRDEVLRIVEQVFEFYKREGRKGERLRDTLERLGLEYFIGKYCD